MDRYLAVVKGRIRGMTRSVSEADDIMQEVQPKIWRRLGSFRSGSSFRTWMTSVAINEARQLYRKAKRFPLVHDCNELPERTSPSESLLQACVRGELSEKLKAAVERLPAKHKQVVVLHNLRELSLQETAQEVGRPRCLRRCCASLESLAAKAHWRRRYILRSYLSSLLPFSLPCDSQ